MSDVIDPSTSGVHQMEVAGVDAATRVWHTHVHGGNENALLTSSNIYKVFDSRITSQVYPLLSDYISSLICTIKAHAIHLHLTFQNK
jgi:hypothetical protein